MTTAFVETPSKWQRGGGGRETRELASGRLWGCFDPQKASMVVFQAAEESVMFECWQAGCLSVKTLWEIGTSSMRGKVPRTLGYEEEESSLPNLRCTETSPEARKGQRTWSLARPLMTGREGCYWVQCRSSSLTQLLIFNTHSRYLLCARPGSYHSRIISGKTAKSSPHGASIPVVSWFIGVHGIWFYVLVFWVHSKAVLFAGLSKIVISVGVIGAVVVKILREQTKKALTGDIAIEVHCDRLALKSFLLLGWAWSLEHRDCPQERSSLLGFCGIPGRQWGRFFWLSLLLLAHWQCCHPNAFFFEIQTCNATSLLSFPGLPFAGRLLSTQVRLVLVFVLLCSHLCYLFY